MYRILCVVAVALACLDAADSFGVGLGARAACRTPLASKSETSVCRRQLVRTSMSTVNVDVGVDVEGDQTGKGADDEEEEEEVLAEEDEDDFVEDEEPSFIPTRDVLAELDSLDDVLGVSTGEDDIINLKPKQVEINKLAVQAALRRWQKHENDNGSSPAQIAMLTERIVYLTKHMQAHPHDYHSRRGLIMLVNRRRKNLNYYYRREPAKCLQMCKTLGIRFRPKSKIRGREQRYAAFTNTKSKIGTARRSELINKEREEQRRVADAKKAAEKEALKAKKMAKREEARMAAAAAAAVPE